MKKPITDSTNLSKEDHAKIIMDYAHRTAMHHIMWFSEVQHQLGRDKAYEVLKEVYPRTSELQLGRIGKTLGFELKDGIPEPLLELPEEQLLSLRKAMAVNWLANDGIWFQAVEFSRDMNDAKRCNDSCWGHFSPFEAWSIKLLLSLPENPGIEGLKKAFQFRLYADINKQSFSDEEDNSFVFKMNDCRVQSARKRKGLDDYPCKSAGLVEYRSFAEAIDPRIKTECIGCPPDNHPEDWYCAWKFSI